MSVARKKHAQILADQILNEQNIVIANIRVEPERSVNFSFFVARYEDKAAVLARAFEPGIADNAVFSAQQIGRAHV